MTAGPDNAYVVVVGPYRADSDPRKGDRLLLSLLVERGMDGPGRCIVELADPRHDPLVAGASVTVSLDAGGGSRTVFTGQTYASAASATAQLVRGADALAKLAATHIEGAYADVTSDFVAKDLIDKAGAQSGVIDAGPLLGSYVLHRQPRALRHLTALAGLAGADVWTDGGGKVHCAGPRQGGADHRFKLGESILALDLQAEAPAAEGIEVWGEGAASSAGADAAHWLTTDLAGVSGHAERAGNDGAQSGRSGPRTLWRHDAALRAGDSAAQVADAWKKATAARGVSGRIELTGAPEVEPGDLIGLDGLSQDHGVAKLLAGGKTLRVRSVRHVLDRARGFRTTLDV